MEAKVLQMAKVLHESVTCDEGVTGGFLKKARLGLAEG
jgi:hypothetical protein